MGQNSVTIGQTHKSVRLSRRSRNFAKHTSVLFSCERLEYNLQGDIRGLSGVQGVRLRVTEAEPSVNFADSALAVDMSLCESV